MRKLHYWVGIIVIATLTACTTTNIAKSKAYKGMYSQRPVSVLIMPPINKTTNVEAKEFFHSTLLAPISEAGYYVIPPFTSMEILKKESAWDSEMFINAPLNKFNEIFGADVALFTVITKWNKTVLANVIVEVEYIVKSTKTNEILYRRKGNITYDASVNAVSGAGLAGLLINAAATAVNTATTKYVDIAKICNAYSLSDLPAGKYSPKCNTDSIEMAGKADFKIKLDSKYSNY